MPERIQAIRGATTVDSDTEEQIFERVGALLAAIFERNTLDHDDIVDVILTATNDIHAAFPALGARKFGLGDVPLLCAQELDIVGGTPRCIRVLLHVYTDIPRPELRHVYLDADCMLRDVHQNGMVLQHKKYRYLGLAYRLFLIGLTVTFALFLIEMALGHPIITV